MRTFRKIQLALGTILLWSSTSVSSFAVTNTITPERNQSVTVKIPVESIPSRQLNLTPDTKLIAQSIRETLSKVPTISHAFSQFDGIWKNPADRQKRLFDYCKSQKDVPVNSCFSYLSAWITDQISSGNSGDRKELRNIRHEIIQLRRAKKP